MRMFHLPEFVTIGQAIDFNHQYGSIIEERAKDIEAMADGTGKQMESIEFEIENAFWMLSFITGEDVEMLTGEVQVNELMELFRTKLVGLFNPDAKADGIIVWNEQTYMLPPPDLKPNSTMTFGEFIDSKVMIQDVIESKGSKWEMLLYVSAIFLRKQDEGYDPSFLFEDSEKLALIKSMPLEFGAVVGNWFEGFTEYLQEYFPVFSESQIKSGGHIKAHMNQWGWTNFLKSIAATKVFDIMNSGMNSIECARAAKAYDVLVSASEEKQYNEAVSLDMEAAYKK